MARRGDRRRDRGKVKRRGAPHSADLGHEDRGIGVVPARSVDRACWYRGSPIPVHHPLTVSPIRLKQDSNILGRNLTERAEYLRYSLLGSVNFQAKRAVQEKASL